jgi:SAM-dependent methyltransferase
MSGGYGSHPLIKKLVSKHAIAKRFLEIVYPPMPTLNVMRPSVLRSVQAKIFQAGSIVVNVGCGGLGGCGYRLWLSPKIKNACVYHMDLDSGPTISLIGDAHDLPFRNSSVDCLIYQAVLEHVKDPQGVIREALRVLKPGGYIYMEVPFLQGFHADPYDFQRYTLEGLRVLTNSFSEIDAGVSVGPFCALVWIIRDGISACFKNRFLYLSARFIVGWLLSPIRYLDYLIRESGASRRLACEYYYLCQKPL